MSELVWGKNHALGDIVQESHKMQIVYLKITYIDLFLFVERKRVHFCQ